MLFINIMTLFSFRSAITLNICNILRSILFCIPKKQISCYRILILDGNSGIGVHVLSTLGYLIR